MKQELTIGALTFVGEKLGSHVHVTVLGAGTPGQRPLCGKVSVTVEEWTSLSDVPPALAALSKAVHDREAALVEIDRLDGVARGLAASHAELRARLEAFAESTSGA